MVQILEKHALHKKRQAWRQSSNMANNNLLNQDKTNPQQKFRNMLELAFAFEAKSVINPTMNYLARKQVQYIKKLEQKI